MRFAKRTKLRWERALLAAAWALAATSATAVPTTLFRYDNNGNLHVVSDTDVDPKNCGAVGNACPLFSNTVPVCDQGACPASESLACRAGFLNCDASIAANGCESHVSYTSSCGRCGNSCPSPAAHGFAECLPANGGYTCGTSCDAGYEQCGPLLCSNLSADLDHCGSCGTVCPRSDNGTASCDGRCRMACNPGYLLCVGPDGGNVCFNSVMGPTGCKLEVGTTLAECVVAPTSITRVDQPDGGGASLVRALPRCDPGLVWPDGSYVECGAAPLVVVREDQAADGSLSRRTLPDCYAVPGMKWPF